jgi:hypothetical protein
MASSSSHLASLSTCQDGIAECKKSEKYEFRAVTCGKMSILNFMKFRPVIL